MTEQKPSVGRVVHYVSHGTPPRADGSQVYLPVCRAAVVTEISNEQDQDGICIGVAVLNPTGMFFNQHICQHEGDTVVDRDERTGVEVFSRSHRGGTWHWPERV